MNLVILAAGRATRMLPVHQNLYPKILVNLGNEVQIQKMLNAYPLAETKTIVVDTEYDVKQVKEMLAALDITNVNVIPFYHGAVGTLHTIRLLVQENKIPTENVMLSWSDICPAGKNIEPTGEFPCDVIFTDTNARHRMSFENGSVVTKTNGNLPGLYFFKNLKKIVGDEPFDFEDLKTTDIANALEHNGFDGISVAWNFIDVGDIPKYEAYLENVNIDQRFFNDIKLLNTTVIKSANNEHGRAVIKAEIEFYDKIKDDVNASKAFPRLIFKSENNDLFEIERVFGKTVNEHVKWLTNDGNDLTTTEFLTDGFAEAISKLHSIKAPESITHEMRAAAMYKEYVEVTNVRYNKIKTILPHIQNVNGVTVNHTKVFDYVERRIQAMIASQPEFCLIHGDPNTSNCFVGTEMKFIDPRGQFGGIRFYGDPAYDYAKFAYGLTGYDNFNLTKDVRFTYCEKTGEISYDCIKGFNLDEITQDNDIKFLVGLIWLKLPYYTINNINKAIVAYAHGLRLLTDCMNGEL